MHVREDVHAILFFFADWQVEISDKLSLDGEAYHTNKIEFTRECKLRWGMTEAESTEYWNECYSDSNVAKGVLLAKSTFWHKQQHNYLNLVKKLKQYIPYFHHSFIFFLNAILGTDERGHTTIAKLTKLCICGGRELAHKRSMNQGEQLTVDEKELPDMKKSYLAIWLIVKIFFVTCDLHTHTSV